MASKDIRLDLSSNTKTLVLCKRIWVLLVNRLAPSDFEDVLHEVVEFLTVFQLTYEISGHQ